MIFTGEQGLNVGGDNSYSFSLERRHNDGLHQWWNIMGCIHAGCQIFTNGSGSDKVREGLVNSAWAVHT
jgi:hypothetical protein